MTSEQIHDAADQCVNVATALTNSSELDARLKLLRSSVAALALAKGIAPSVALKVWQSAEAELLARG